MQADIRRVGEILAASEDVLILTHKNPDGDCLGTGVALCRYLLSLGKRATVVNADPIPSKFDYLFEGLPQETFEPKCIISVDVADPKLLGPLEDLADRVDLCIDHHRTEFIDIERLAITSNALLFVQRRFPIFQINGQPNECHQP